MYSMYVPNAISGESDEFAFLPGQERKVLFEWDNLYSVNGSLSKSINKTITSHEAISLNSSWITSDFPLPGNPH